MSTLHLYVLDISERISRFAAGPKIIVSGSAALFWSLTLFFTSYFVFGLSLNWTNNYVLGPFPVGVGAIITIFVIGLNLVALEPILLATFLGYSKIELWRWGLAGLASLVVGSGIYLYSGSIIYNFGYSLTRSNALQRQLHALPLALSVACFLAISWLGTSSSLRRDWRGFLLGLFISITLATSTGTVLYGTGVFDAWFTVNKLWIVPSLIWSSAVYFIERAAGRADRTAFLTWLGIIALMFVFPLIVLSVVR